MDISKIRNIAIIAHVDHGKTTFVDALLRQSGSVAAAAGERIMDSNDLEKERGITVLSKCTSIWWKGHLINILDTPGHSDFGAEVERILGMVDAFILLVDAVEGVMPQTKFVLSKAAVYNLKPLLMINKIDREAAADDDQVNRVVNEVLDELFLLALEANKEEARSAWLEPRIFYGSGRAGYAASSLQRARSTADVHEILDAVIEYVPHPTQVSERLQMLVSIVDIHEYAGKLLIGKIHGGSVAVGDTVHLLDQTTQLVETTRVTNLFCFEGTRKKKVERAEAGEIVALAGSKKGTVNHTIVSDPKTAIIEAPEIDPPTLSVAIGVNTSPFSGKEGSKLTSRLLRERLMYESETNVGIKVDTEGEEFKVSGRGELQISILAEQMRREGFEFLTGRPKTILRYENGIKLEPTEEVTISVEAPYANIVSEQMRMRGADTLLFESEEKNVKMRFKIPTRGLLGYYSKFLSDTRGTGVMSKRFLGYEPYKGEVTSRRNGVMIAMEEGEATAYALDKLSDRGIFFISPGEQVYVGMIVGEHNRESDIHVNVTKGKKLTNVRASSKDEAIILTPPIRMDLQRGLDYISDDTEMVEVTPKSIRLIKTK